LGSLFATIYNFGHLKKIVTNKCKIFLEILVIDVTPRLKNKKKKIKRKIKPWWEC
jgi:hypothetical protein